jgi:iron transport multicopper oxidase
MTLADWLVFVSEVDNTLMTRNFRYHIPSPSAAPTPIPDATLINGLGRYPGGPISALAVVNVSSNKRYRIRLVSISCYPNYMFSIDNHIMVIRADRWYKCRADLS